jgi:phosphoribosylanthranilate isomerase
MTDQHPITPPSELLQLWFEQHDDYNKGINELLIEAVQYGADQELEACCALLEQKGVPAWSLLRLHRRPKPPSLKEQALDAHNRMMAGTETQDDWTIVRRALEALPE